MHRAIMIVATTCLAALSVSTAGSAAARPPGGNGQIAFARYSPELDDTVIYTVNPDGSSQHQVVPFALECPQWSPDGSRIATCGGPDDSATAIVDPDTGNYRLLPMADAELFTGCSVWAPDARRLACGGFSDSDPSRNGIYTIRTSDGQGLTRMTSNPSGDDEPGSYSPNGHRLVFARYDADENSLGLFVVHTDGTHLRRIAPSGVTCCAGGDWSPTGNDIVFSRHVTPDVHSSIWIVHADGSNLREVPVKPTADCGGANDDAAAVGCFDPRWSPDGSRIVFGRGTEDLGRNIYTVRPDGSDLRMVTHGDASQSNEVPDWGPHPLAA
jgi:TolB protein